MYMYMILLNNNQGSGIQPLQAAIEGGKSGKDCQGQKRGNF